MKRTMIIYGSLSICLCIAWLMLIFLPQRKEMSSLQTQMADLSTRLESSQQDLKSLPLLLQDRQSDETRVVDHSQQAWSVSSLPGLFDHLRGKASQYNLTVTDITPALEQLVTLRQEPSATDETGHLDMKLSLKGSYSDFGRFAESLNESAFVVRVIGCNIASNPSDWKDISYTYDFTVRLLGSDGGA